MQFPWYAQYNEVPMDIALINYRLDFSEFETNLLKILFYTLPTMIFLWRGIQGWRMGLKRKIAALLSLLGGISAAYWLGTLAIQYIPRGIIAHPFAKEVVGIILAGVVAYIGLRLLFAAILRFDANDDKSTADGTGGLVLGLIEGLSLIWAFALIVRWSAEISEAYVLAQSPEAASPNEILERETPNLNFAARASVYWNQRAKEGFIDNWIEKTDPIPEDFYDLSKNLVILARNPKVLTEFAQTPEVVRFLTDPSLTGLVNDPVIMNHYRSDEYLLILQQPSIHALLKDRDFLQRIRDAGIDEALVRSVRKVHGKTREEAGRNG